MTSNLSWLDSFGRSEEQDKEFFAGSNLSAVKPQKKEPGLFDGTLDALGYMAPNAFFQTMGGAEELSAYKLSQMYELDLDTNEDALSEPIKADKDKIIQRAENEAKYYRLKAKNDWTPNPETTGAAAQMIHAMGSTILKAAGYSVIAGGNPYFGGAMFGADIGLNEYGTLRDKGVDAKTAKQAGWASGALNALGLAIPGSIGTSYLKSAALGAIVNPASDIAEQASIKFILENADYEKIAGEYDPFNPANLAVSSGVGVAFGLMGAKGARSRARRAEEFAKQDAELAKLQEEAKNAQESVGENKAQDSSRLNQEVLSSIQSRNLSTPESVKRTKEIAEDPDFNLVSESRVIEKGSPVIAFVETPNSKTIGKEVVVTDNNGNEMTMRYAVVEANSIHTSNDVEGKQNPDFVNPDVLGARAIEGNDSVVGLKSAYENNTAGQYREELLSQSKNFGISRGKIKNMHQPILVRMMKDEDVKAHISEPPKGSDTQKTVPAEQEVQGTEVDSTVSQGEAVLKKQITPDTVDAAMELNSARVITKDQPSGQNGNINKSLQDEATAREQIDDGKKVEVTGEGVDPEVMGNNVSSFITRFVKELVGAGADKKVAGMNARVIDAFFSTMGVRLGKSRKEIEAEYELKVRNGEDPSKNSYAQEAGVPQVRPGAVSKSDKLYVAPVPKFETIVVATDKDGKNHRVLGVNGDPNLTIIPEGIKGVKPLPVRLQETTLNGIHIRKHETQLKKALGYESVEQAIWDVSQNWRWIFKGSKENCIRLIRPFEIAKNRNLKKTVLQIELQEVAGVYRVGSIFYSDKKIKEEDILFDRQPYDHGPLSQYETAIGLNSAPTSLKTGQSSSLPSILTQEKNSERDLYQTQAPTEPLVTVHNLSEENLNKAMDLGGLAVPSLGITKRDTAYADFGDISLIGTKDMVDPRKGTPVFSQDAYTQTFPEPVWDKSVKPEGAKEVSREFEAAAKERGFTDEGQKLTHSLQANPNRKNFIHSLLTSNVGAYLFLKSKGIKLDPVMTKPGNFSKIVTDSDFIKVAEEIYKTDPTLAESKNIKRLSDAYIESFEKNGGEGGPLVRKLIARAKENGTPLKKEKLRSLMSEAIESKKNFVPTEDKLQTGYALKDKANEYRGEFEQWAEKQADKAFGEPMIKVGNQLKPITLENVVKAMKSSVVVNKEKTMTVGAGKVRARSAQKFKSIEEIQNNRDKVTDSETANIQNAYIAGKMERFRQLASKDSNFQDSFDAFNEAMDALAKVAGSRGKITEDKVRAELKKRGFDASDETVKLGVDILERLDKSLTDYFEAKPQRAVKFNEFAGAVVPKKTAPETIARLEKEGIKVAVYDETLPDGRQKAITELTDSLQKERDDILYQNGRKGIYTPGERVITLLQSADESTFIHESGHYFLDVLTDVAMKENAPDQVKADVQTLMDWFGVKDLEEWRSLSIDEQRAAHEQFARGFEQYLREGEAPSTALEKVFKAFKDWLTKIYKSSEELQVEISPEVRAVYDRLLATDEQIRAKQEAEAPTLDSGMKSEEPTNPVVKAVQQTAEQVIDQAPISEDSKARIRETLGINQPEQQTGENHPHYGIPNEEQFMNQNLETSAIDDPNAFIVLDDGREVSMGDYMREIESEQKQELDRANSVSEVAQCMYRNGTFDDVF
ncbi:hypothetical protein [Turicimonas muris]|uniref:hypothetical protein n=1 Tax=Turicimonas muris TaxID=1796652 RepID=UPI0025730832|nr:hypothetical protein [Turicimonas muris]